jgi:hypothetical protein
MDLICNAMLFVQPKYHDENYAPLSAQIKQKTSEFLEELELQANTSGRQLITEQSYELLRFLSKLLETMDNSASLRPNLIRFRNELELYKSTSGLGDNDTPQSRMLELLIQVVNLLHYGTFYCFSLEVFDERYATVKLEFEYFRDLIRTNTSPQLNEVDKHFLSILYKVPKLMKIKLGYKKAKRESRLNEELE